MDVEYILGEKCPHPLTGDGMRLAVTPTPVGSNNGLEIIFFVVLPNMLREEELIFRDRPIKIGILPFPPIVFLLLIADVLKFDAPYAIGACDPAHLSWLLNCAEMPRAWSVNTRRPINIGVVEGTTQIIRHLRTATLTKGWWVKLADAFAACPRSLSPTDYRSAKAAAYERWPTPDAMLSACSIAEVVGI